MQLVKGDAGRFLLILPRNRLYKLQIKYSAVITHRHVPTPGGACCRRRFLPRKVGFRQKHQQKKIVGLSPTLTRTDHGVSFRPPWQRMEAGETRGSTNCNYSRTTKGPLGWHTAMGQP